MSRDFAAELGAIYRRYPASPRVNSSVQLGHAVKNEARCMILRQSLPVAVNKVVGVGFTLEQANREILRLLSKHDKVENGCYFSEADQRWYFYQVVDQDAVEQRDPFWNPKVFVMEAI